MTAPAAAPSASRPLGPDPDDLLWVVARPADGRGRAVVEAVGEVDGYTAPLLASCLHGPSARAAVRTLVVDLSRVRLLSAAGVAALEEAAARCARRGAPMLLRTGDRPAGSLHAMRARGGWGTRNPKPGHAGPPTRGRDDRHRH